MNKLVKHLRDEDVTEIVGGATAPEPAPGGGGKVITLAVVIKKIENLLIELFNKLTGKKPTAF